MAFSTWNALKTQILDALADGSILTRQYQIGGRMHTFRSLDEVMEFLKYCDTMIAVVDNQGNREALVKFVR